jgi:hypothetical protein
MSHLFLIFWTVMIFASIAWYGFLLFYIGFKGGREIKEMTKTLSKENSARRAGRGTE